MRLPRATMLVAAAAIAAAVAGAAGAHSPAGTATYYRITPDPRACPSPICGGWWVRRVNRDDTVCGDGAAAPQCYAASIDLSELELTEQRRLTLEQAVSTGTTLVRGRLVRKPTSQPPLKELDTFVATEVWLRAGAAATPGVVYRVEDNGIRCVRAPCFWLHVSVLNTTRHRNASTVALAPSKASPTSIRRALAALDDTGVMVEGRVVAGEPRGDRTLRATAFWLRAA
jgi:hypothetical protein